MTALVANQFRDYKKLARKVRTMPKCDSPKAAKAGPLIEKSVRSAVESFYLANRGVEQWQEFIAQGHSGEIETLGAKWEALYQDLAAIFEKNARLIRQAEKIQIEIAGKHDFMVAWQELRGIVCFSLERLALADEQVKRGEAQALGDIEREILHLPGA